MNRPTVPRTSRRPSPGGASFKAFRHSGVIVVFAGLTAALGGCVGSPTHSIIVGSVPRDYRTEHPIIVSEQEQTLDIPVASGERHLTRGTGEIVAGYADGYKHSASGIVRIMVPHGSRNAGAASIVSRQVRHKLVARGVSSSRIIVVGYDAGDYHDAPIRLAYRATAAHTTPCGRWPADLADSSENRSYENFGCATQSNLAAQVANPADLLAPRAMSPIDSQRRTTVYDDYISNGSDVSQSN